MALQNQVIVRLIFRRSLHKRGSLWWINRLKKRVEYEACLDTFKVVTLEPINSLLGR